MQLEHAKTEIFDINHLDINSTIQPYKEYIYAIITQF